MTNSGADSPIPPFIPGRLTSPAVDDRSDGAGGNTYTFHRMNPRSAARMIERIEARRGLTEQAQSLLQTTDSTPSFDAAQVPDPIPRIVPDAAPVIKPVSFETGLGAPPPANEQERAQQNQARVEENQRYWDQRAQMQPTPAPSQTNPPAPTKDSPKPSTPPAPQQTTPTAPGPAQPARDTPTDPATPQAELPPTFDPRAVRLNPVLQQFYNLDGTRRTPTPPPAPASPAAQQAYNDLPPAQRAVIDQTVGGQITFERKPDPQSPPPGRPVPDQPQIDPALRAKLEKLGLQQLYNLDGTSPPTELQGVGGGITAMTITPLPAPGQVQVLPGGIVRLNDTTTTEDGRSTTRTIITQIPGMEPLVDVVSHQNINPEAGMFPTDPSELPKHGKPAVNADPFTGWKWQGIGGELGPNPNGLLYQQWDLIDDKGRTMRRVYATFIEGKLLSTEAVDDWPRGDWSPATGVKLRTDPMVRGTNYQNGVPVEYYTYDQHATKVPRDPNYLDPGTANVDLAAEGIIFSVLPVPYGGITRMVFRAGEFVVDGVASGVRVVKGATVTESGTQTAAGTSRAAESTTGIGATAGPEASTPEARRGLPSPENAGIGSSASRTATGRAESDATAEAEITTAPPRNPSLTGTSTAESEATPAATIPGGASHLPQPGITQPTSALDRNPGFAGGEYQPSQAEQAMNNSKIVGSPEPVAGSNTNLAFTVTLDIGSSSIYKPIFGESLAGRIGTPVPMGYNEVLAARIDEILDFGLVPPTGLIAGPRGTGSNQLWMESIASLPYVRYPRSQRERMAVFDYVIGNADRHYKNFLTDPNGNLIAIDHGHSFPFTPDPIAGIRSDFVYNFVGVNLSPEMMAKVRAVDTQHLRIALKDTGLPAASIDGVLARLAEIRTHGRITGDAWPGIINPGKIPPAAPPATGSVSPPKNPIDRSLLPRQPFRPNDDQKDDTK
ncbi:hypothetical protein ACFWF7_03725 [Nocardia sp. NPDC060256]|uniref:hypothetical protein n=1 Tax=unclassified Nocardia TaxID=2637762 RepID=UPI0036579BB2